ncbi:copper resistance protein CopC [Actinoplanes sp. NPDC023936]|uniref:copper resistance CopC/CopD family protein n=1 Tax=Actinoplanes sp. NPDC023936 TaxID=3154910 RepID=UPI00340EC7DD
MLLVAIVGATLALPTQAAYAHAQLLSSTPANGATLPQPPTEIRFHFSEEVSLVGDGVQVLSPDGSRVETRVQQAAGADVVVALPGGLGTGAYTVSWRVVSADSHPIHGAVVFGVGDATVLAAPAAGAQTGSAGDLTVAFAVVRGAGYVLLALLGGGLIFLFWCWPQGLARPDARRLLRYAAAGSLACAVASLLLQAAAVVGGSLADVGDAAGLANILGSDYGWYVLARIGLLIIGSGLLIAASRPGAPARRLLPAATIVLGVLLPVTWVGTGHANAGPSVFPRLADAVHLVAMTAWLGGLAMMVLALLRGRATSVDESQAALSRFSRIATVAVLLLVITGSYRAIQEVGSFGALTGSPYGALLVYKIAAVGVLLWCGSMSRSLVRKRLEPGGRSRTSRDLAAARQRHLRVLLWSETGIGAAVLAVTALLVATPPATRPAAPPGPRTVELTMAGGTAEVRVDPPLAGPSRLSVTVRDSAGAQREVPEVRVALTLPQKQIGPLDVPLRRLGRGSYDSAELRLPIAGDWQLKLTVRTSEIDQHTVTATVPVS